MVALRSERNSHHGFPYRQASAILPTPPCPRTSHNRQVRYAVQSESVTSGSSHMGSAKFTT
ncbi:hypothetical protein FTUN_3188 [Frigoriglobus tundricola]|uniref:Uncharacterized protein n=1 Tax=Frigoriglobus tundricola TaxID=2774151 RepID=A0A6M5YNK9_9BACT|nr:hypothetical protein FTUN_3188 [Frigoriglobus tundricola]